ncbi:hypothetical protein NDU88_001259 [Pleurodeles waltl]|uniref:Uncharacterized protein n=1 Tax=Pleurodeles waltl TaxID=8319 RepID=A0AAV7UTT5_PLEWA|nr:hypothetical protein NDU88_001259 [Pleurodeles waltl]
MASRAAPAASGSTASATDTLSDTATECILQEITEAGLHLKAMDSKITDLSTASHSIWSDISSFHNNVTNLDHRLTEVKGRLAVPAELDSELQFFCAKLDNVCFFDIQECKEGTDVRAYLRELLLELTGLTFSPALEFQRALRIGPIHKADSGKPCPIIACFLPHEQACQVITVAKAHAPYNMEGNDI